MTNPPETLRCRWCGWTTNKVYTRADGQVRSGWPKLQNHIEFAHEAETLTLANDLGVEDIDLVGEQ